MTASCCVSVVIPVYNGEAFIAESVASALAQSLTALEVLVVDDGSTDRSAEIVTQLAARDSRVRLLAHPKGENRGVSRSRWLGVSQARGQYVAFLDADDLFEPNKLECQVAALEAHPDCILCHSAVEAFSADDVSRAREFETHFSCLGSAPVTYSFHERPDALRFNPVCNSTVVVRAEQLRDVRFAFPQLFQFEDFLLWELLSLSGRFLYLPEKLARYRVHAEAASTAVGKNQLVQIYSQIEMLLSVLALVDDERLRKLADRELREALNSALKLYAEGGGKDVFTLWGESGEDDHQTFYPWLKTKALTEKLQQLRTENVQLTEAFARLEAHPIFGRLLRLRQRLLRWMGAGP